MSILLLFLMGAQTTATQPSRPRLLNLASVIKRYPEDAMRSGQQGTTGILLTINPKGRVENCTIELSSGSPSLDAAACDQFSARARYSPATDATGQAVSATIHTNVVWKAHGDPWPLNEWSSRAALTITGGGHVRSCVKELTSPITEREPSCDDFVHTGMPLLFALRNDKHYFDRFKGDKVVVVEFHFFPTSQLPATKPGDEPNQELVARVTTAFDIGTDGRVSNCHIIESVGQRDLRQDLCHDFFDGPFQSSVKPGEQPTAIPAHGMFAVYVRK